jgi:hypothetical protein
MTLRLGLQTAAAVAALAVAVLLVLLGVDVVGWDGQAGRASVAFQSSPQDPGIWEPSTILPVGISERLLGADDDVAFDRGLQRYWVLRHQPTNVGSSGGAAFEASQVRTAQTELAIERLTRRSLPRSLRSRAQELAAIVLFQSTFTASSAASSPFDRTREEFSDAIRTDRANDSAKTNLERLLWLYTQVLHVTPEQLRLHPNQQSQRSPGGGSPGVTFGQGGY